MMEQQEEEEEEEQQWSALQDRQQHVLDALQSLAHRLDALHTTPPPAAAASEVEQRVRQECKRLGLHR